MKKLITIIAILLGVNMHTLAYDFQSEQLLYTILNTNPPSVRLDGHINGTSAQGDLVIPEEVTFDGVTYTVVSINGYAFYECKHLKSISIPYTIQEIGIDAFTYCSNIDEVYYNAKHCADIEDYEQLVFDQCTGHLIIGDSVDRIPKYMFRQGYFNELTIIGHSNTVIGEYAFLHCERLSGKLSLGKVAHIEAGAFWGHNTMSITSITIDREQPPTLEINAFSSINKDISVNVPCGSIELYQNTERWDEFTHFANHLIYSVRAVSEDENKGIVDLIKVPDSCNDLMVEVSAIPSDGYEFLHWEIDGDTVSNENPYFFDLDNNVSLIARFRFHPDSLLLSNSEWYYEILDENGSITYQHLQCTGDTTIGNERPKIIIRSNTHYDRDGIITETTHEYIYEEDGRVYWWNKDLEEFTILYNSAAEVGDSWEIKVGTESLIMHVYAVDNYKYSGRAYKVLWVNDENELFSGNIVCGIGHMISFFPERLMNRGDGYRVTGLRCYWVAGNLVFKGIREDCDAIYSELHNGLDEPTGEAAFVVYPNPTNGVLFVETHGRASLQTAYRITNLMGQTIFSGNITVENQRIDISNLPAGMYFISVGEQIVIFVKR